MARPASGNNFNIAQLERVLEEKRGELEKLRRQRSEVQKKLTQIDRQIERVEGGMNGSRRGGGTGGGGRARNAQSLNETLEMVLREAGRPMKVSEIMEGALGAGYRSGSVNFRGIINQTLIKDKRFGQVERGVYELKGGGEPKKRKEKESKPAAE